MSRILQLIAFVCTVICSGFLFNVAGVPVGIIGEANALERIGFVYSAAPGGEVREAPKSFEKGAVSFWLPRRASNFRFVFEASDQPFLLDGITVFGVKMLAPGWLVGGCEESADLRFSGGAPGSGGGRLTLRVGGHQAQEFLSVNAQKYIFYAQRVVSFAIAFVPWLVFICFFAWFHRRLIGVLLRSAYQSKAFFALFMIVGVICSLPVPIEPVVEGYDASWVWLINKFALSHSFGTEMVFTYGPLGFLLYPQMEYLHMLLGLLFSALYFTAWGVVAFRLYALARPAAFIWIISSFIPHGNLEWQYVTLLAVSPAVALQGILNGTSLRLKFAPDCALIAFSAFMLPVVMCVKFSMLVPVGASHAVLLTGAFYKARAWRRQLASWYFVPFILGLITVFFAFWGGLQVFFDWFVQSIEIARGYNLTMNTDKSWFELSLPFVVLTLSVAWVLRKEALTKKTLFLGLSSMPIVFVTTKYSICRQGICPLLVALGAGLIMAVLAYPRAGRRALLLALILPMGGVIRTVVCEAMMPDAYYKGALKTVMAGKTFERVSSVRPKSLLPEAWIKRMAQKRVQALPIEQRDLMAPGDLKVTPLYCLQLYSAYTPMLDELCAAQYLKATAPDYIVCARNARSMDSRHVIRDNPRVFASLKANYEVADFTESEMLLQKRPVRLASKFTEVAKFSGKVGEWFEVPRTAEFFALKWPQTLPGALTTLLLRNTITFMEVRYEDGEVAKIRILPSTMSHPVPLEAGFGDDVAILWQIKAGKKVVQLRFTAETPFIYAPCVQLEFSRRQP